MRLAKPLNAAASDATIEAEQLRNSVKSPPGLLVELLIKFGRLAEALCCSCRNNPASLFSLILGTNPKPAVSKKAIILPMIA